MSYYIRFYRQNYKEILDWLYENKIEKYIVSLDAPSYYAVCHLVLKFENKEDALACKLRWK